jgi:hypothetical protein
MCYYHVDLAARRFLELGREVPDGLKKLRIDPHGWDGSQNAEYKPGPNYITMGSGFGYDDTFVPAAEDADVIWHEYGHAIQCNFPGVGPGFEDPITPGGQANLAGALQEGSSDYWAASYRRSLYPNNNWGAHALWFNMGPNRRVDLNWKYPDDYDITAISGHRNGQIWSSALMKIWADLGRDITDNLFLEMHLNWGDASHIRDGATEFMQVAKDFIKKGMLNSSQLCQIYSRFQEHGLIDPDQDLVTTSFVDKTVNKDRTVISCDDLDVQDIIVTNNAELTLKAPGNINLQRVRVEPSATLILEAGGKVWYGPGFKVELGGVLKRN